MRQRYDVSSMTHAIHGAVPTPVFDRATLRTGHRIDGPAVAEQLDATTVIAPGDRARVDKALNIIIEVDG